MAVEGPLLRVSRILRPFPLISFLSRDGINPRNGFSFVLGNQWQHEMVGLANQTAPEMDLLVSDAIRNTLFENVDANSRPGDLVARNIQRGRDHGIPGYDKLRRACGMAEIVNREAPVEINRETWRKLMRTYKNDPSQIDGFTAGLSETAPADGMVSSQYFLASQLNHNCRLGPSSPVSLRGSLRISGTATDSSSVIAGAQESLVQGILILRDFLRLQR